MMLRTGVSPFGVDHAEQIFKAERREEEDSNTGRNVAVAGGATAAAGTAAVMGTKMPEHQHYSKKTRKKLDKLPPGEHEIKTKHLAKNPRKLGARKQQRSYVAAMAQERPLSSYGAVPITRYKDGSYIQRDNAHTVMANAMKGRKTKIKIEEAPGYRPNRRTAEELVRRGQSKFQEKRLARSFNLPEKKIERLRSDYKAKSRKANTSKRPHGVVEDKYKYSDKKYSVKRALGAGKTIAAISKSDNKDQVAAGVAGGAGVGVLAATPVRRSAEKVDIKNGKISATDAKKIVSPGYRPGNKTNMKSLANNLGPLEDKPTRVIQYKDGSVIPFDGNHRATARIARGDKKIPVDVVQGKNRPTVSAARNAVHVGQQRVHRARMERDAFKPDSSTAKHRGESKTYSRIANASPSRRDGSRVAVGSTKVAQGPSNAMLRTKQGAFVAGGVSLLGGAAHLATRGEKDDIKKSSTPLTSEEIKRRKAKQAKVAQATGALGLAALGGTALATRPGQKALSTAFGAAGKKVPTKLQAKKKPESIDNSVTPLLATSAGIGSLGSFNFARYTRAEAEKGKGAVKKSAFGVSTD